MAKVVVLQVEDAAVIPALGAVVTVSDGTNSFSGSVVSIAQVLEVTVPVPALEGDYHIAPLPAP